MALSNLQNPWGTSGDPFAQYESLIKELGLREEGGDFMMRRPDSPGDQIAYQSIYGEEGLGKLNDELRAARDRTVTINGQQFERIGDPSSPSAAFGQQFYPQVRQAAQYDPTHGWVLPKQLADYLTQASYTGNTSWLAENMSWFGPAVGMAAMVGAAMAGAGGGTGAAALGGTEAATAAGLGEGIGAEAYFAGATPAAGAGEFSLAGGGAGGLQISPAVGSNVGEYGLGTAGTGSTGLGGGATRSGLGGNAPILGAGGGAGVGAGQQSDAYRDVANQYFGIGAPYRGTLEASYQPGFNLMNQPGYGDAFQRAADISARGYSAKFGNPQGRDIRSAL